jgi:predicted MFS family arabinose efflux permease
MWPVETSNREAFGALAGGSLAMAAAMGIGRFAYTPILPVMQHALGFSTGTAGLLASENYAGYLVGAIVVTVAPARVPRRGVLVGSLIAIAITTALMAGTTNHLVWGIVRFLSGVASAGVFILASGLVIEALRRQGRTALAGWMFAGIGIGIAASGVAVRLATGALGWRGDWLVLGVVTVAAVYPCWRWLPHADSRGGPASSALSGTDGAPSRALALLFPAYFLEAIGYIVTGTFLVAIVSGAPGSRAAGTSVWIVAGLAGIPSAVLWTAAAARIGVARALTVAYAAQACGILLPILGGVGPAYGSAILFGGTFIGMSALTMTLAGQLAPHRTGNVIGLLTAVFGVGQIIGPVFAAALESRAHSFTPALIVASGVVFVGGALMVGVHVMGDSERQPAGT